MARDKNEVAREQEQVRRQRVAFAQALVSGQAAPLDRFGAILRAGDLAIVTPPHPWMMTIADVRTPVDPRVPVGMVEVTLTVTTKITLPANQATPNFLRVGVVSADGLHRSIEGVMMPVASAEVATGDPTTEPDLSPEAILDADAPPVEPSGPRLVLTDVPSLIGDATNPTDPRHAPKPPKDDGDERD